MAGFFSPAAFQYKDTGEKFTGQPSTIKMGSDVFYYDAAGRELLPLDQPAKEPTAAEVWELGFREGRSSYA